MAVLDLRDRGADTVTEIDGVVSRFTHREGGGQNLTGDQFAMTLRPLLAVLRDLEHDVDPVRDVQTGSTARILQLTDTVLGPSLGFEFLRHSGIEYDQSRTVRQCSRRIRLGRNQFLRVLLGQQFDARRNHDAVRVLGPVAPP